MKTNFRMACLAATALMFSTHLVGCVECSDEQREELEVEDDEECITTPTTYTGEDRVVTVAHTPGDNIVINGVNGQIRVDDSGAEGGEVQVTFSPFTQRAEGENEEAAAEFENNLTTTAEAGSGEIQVTASRSGGSSSLGADIVVRIPRDFTGTFTLNQNNGSVEVDLTEIVETGVTVDNDGAGDVDVRGVNSTFTVTGEFDVRVDVSEFPATGTSTAQSFGQLGDIRVSVPSASSGSIAAQAGGTLSVEPSVPASWAEEASAENSKTWTLGDGGAVINVAGNSDIVIAAR